MIKQLLVSLFLISLSSCVGVSGFKNLQPIQGAPPHKIITVLESFHEGNGILTLKFIWPTGDYTPMLEDATGFLYKAPSKIITKDTGMTKLYEGGIFLEKGTTIPTHGYFIDPSSNLPIKIKVEDEIKVKTQN